MTEDPQWSARAPGDLGETMLEEMRAGTAPDVLQGCCTFFPIWAQRGHLLDLGPFIERDLPDEVLSDWGEGTSDTGNSQSGRGAEPTTDISLLMARANAFAEGDPNAAVLTIAKPAATAWLLAGFLF